MPMYVNEALVQEVEFEEPSKKDSGYFTKKKTYALVAFLLLLEAGISLTIVFAYRWLFF